MFTGIVTDLGTVRRIVPGPVTRLEIETAYPTAEIADGASVCCAGCCLSVVEKGSNWLAFDVSGETLSVNGGRDFRKGFGPLLVTMDAHGGSLHADVTAAALSRRDAILAKLGAT